MTASMCQSGSVVNHSNSGSAHHGDTTIGINLAKNVFQVHGVDQARGRFRVVPPA
jgi:hypothetical protein